MVFGWIFFIILPPPICYGILSNFCCTSLGFIFYDSTNPDNSVFDVLTNRDVYRCLLTGFIFIVLSPIIRISSGAYPWSSIMSLRPLGLGFNSLRRGSVAAYIPSTLILRAFALSSIG